MIAGEPYSHCQRGCEDQMEMALDLVHVFAYIDRVSSVSALDEDEDDCADDLPF